MSLASSKPTKLHAKPRTQQQLARARFAKPLMQQQTMPVTHTSQQRTPSTVVHHMPRTQLQLASTRASKLPAMLPGMHKTLLTVPAGRASKQPAQLSRVTTRLQMLPARRASKQLAVHSRHITMQQALRQMQPQLASTRASRQPAALPSMLTTLMSLPRILQVSCAG